ncbi:uncharacterized protein LOC141908629 isoform X2 [Tubulanus polymorphus]|uniref:uncharacterized protein LOC141908629 isoform X2 n=1 Tax=Tubulanus polymorphus TaxID=672921 RepID=UPI003DA2B385
MATRFNYSDFVWNLYSIMAERRDLFMWDGAESTAAAVAAAAVQHSNHNMSASAGQNSSRNGIPEWLSSRPVTSEPSGLSSGRGINANTDWRGIPSRNNHHEPTTPTSTASSSSPVSYHQSAVKQNVIQGFGGPSIGGRSAGELSSQCQPSTPNSFSPPASALTNNNNQLVVPQPLKPATKTKRSYQCKMCDQKFENKSDVFNHGKETHGIQDKAHPCPNCYKSFASPSQLHQHSLVHTGIRKYQCKYCEKAFKQISHLQQHTRIHTGEKPYKCSMPYCNKSFAQLASLQHHQRNHDKNDPTPPGAEMFDGVNIPDGEKPYKCNIPDCNKAFAQLSNLQHHQRNHDNTKAKGSRKSFYCTVCQRGFVTESSLDKHISRLHSHLSQHSNSPTKTSANSTPTMSPTTATPLPGQNSPTNHMSSGPSTPSHQLSPTGGLNLTNPHNPMATPSMDVIRDTLRESMREVVRENMREASLRAEANYREANMREASMREASMRDMNMRDMNMRDMSMRDMSMRDMMRDMQRDHVNMREMREANMREMREAMHDGGHSDDRCATPNVMAPLSLRTTHSQQDGLGPLPSPISSTNQRPLSQNMLSSMVGTHTGLPPISRLSDRCFPPISPPIPAAAIAAVQRAQALSSLNYGTSQRSSLSSLGRSPSPQTHGHHQNT